MELTADEARAEIVRIKHELNSPKTTLFATKKAYKRIGELWAIVDKEEALEDSHSTRP